MRALPVVGVIDYGAGNLVSIDQALTGVGAEVRLVRQRDELDRLTALVVPGVGAAGPAMSRLARARLVDPILDWIGAGRPYLGICLGLQLLFDASEEDGTATLGVIGGPTVRLVDAPTLPHIGWNQVVRRREHPLFDGIAADADFYFVHSYAGLPTGPRAADVVIADTVHGRPFASAVARDALFGVQFHPERSGADGLRLLANFVQLAVGINARSAGRASGRRSALPGTARKAS
ncbi:MAG: imidazole glycerol phosphate synthase subunit HisH [Chloroflexota bacterium]|nr:imidazole glycerol phosphate synthase subunit HisH [Chloroflexota bacterium]